MSVVFTVFMLLSLSATTFFAYQWAVSRYERKVIAESQAAQEETRRCERFREVESAYREALRLLEEKQRRVNRAQPRP